MSRRPRLYAARSVYVAVLIVLLATAWQVLAGTQTVRGVSDLARFGKFVFAILAPLQLVLLTSLAALAAAAAVAREKDRHTIDLLLVTRLSNSELVLGKLLASLVGVGTLLLSGLPVFGLLTLLGGVGWEQVGRCFIVTAAAVLLGGTLGSTLALWREKTFQALALTWLVLVAWTVAAEAVARGALGPGVRGAPCAWLAAAASPWHALHSALQISSGDGTIPGGLVRPDVAFLAVASLAALLGNGLAIARVRAWTRRGDDVRTAAATRSRFMPWPRDTARRAVGDRPLLWREMQTRAYGRRAWLVRGAYLAMFFATLWAMTGWGQAAEGPPPFDLALVPLPLAWLGLLVVNAQAVASLTSERDGRSLDLLLVTDLTPREFVFSKLLGSLYNTREMVVLPLVLATLAWHRGGLGAETLTYLTVGWLTLVAFSAVLGLHAGMTYANTRWAIGVSLGTLFFLSVGVAVSMRIMVAFSGSFEFQLQPFLAAIVGGSVALYLALGVRNPSAALLVATLVGPLATFYALTSFLLNHALAVFLAVELTYAFTTAAMLVPALHECDIATGDA